MPAGAVRIDDLMQLPVLGSFSYTRFAMGHLIHKVALLADFNRWGRASPQGNPQPSGQFWTAAGTSTRTSGLAARHRRAHWPDRLGPNLVAADFPVLNYGQTGPAICSWRPPRAPRHPGRYWHPTRIPTGRRRRIVLLGHSRGGILARML